MNTPGMPPQPNAQLLSGMSMNDNMRSAIAKLLQNGAGQQNNQTQGYNGGLFSNPNNMSGGWARGGGLLGNAPGSPFTA